MKEPGQSSNLDNFNVTANTTIYIASTDRGIVTPLPLLIFFCPYLILIFFYWASFMQMLSCSLCLSALSTSRKPEALRGFLLAPVAMRIEGGIADTMFPSFFKDFYCLIF